MMKGYGRLASYTIIDRVFGGHLLSSIVCQTCQNCTQVETITILICIYLYTYLISFVNGLNNSFLVACRTIP